MESQKDKRDAVIETMERAWSLMQVWIQVGKGLGYSPQDITVAATLMTAMLFAGAEVDRAAYLHAMGEAFDDSGELFKLLKIDPSVFSKQAGDA